MGHSSFNRKIKERAASIQNKYVFAFCLSFKIVGNLKLCSHIETLIRQNILYSVLLQNQIFIQ